MAVTQANINTVTAGAQGGATATGTITVATNPSNNDTVTVNGVVITFKTSGATGNQVNIGGDTNTTAASLQALLAASTSALLKVAAYTVATNVVTITYKVPGTAGNAFTLAKSGTHPTLSGAVLSGGSDASVTELAPVEAGGLVATANADSSFEKTLLAVVAAVDFALQNGVSPASNFLLCRQQRKLLKSLLADLSAAVPNVADTADDRTTIATTVRTRVLKKYNNIADDMTNE